MEHFDDPTRDLFVVGLDSDQELFHLAARAGPVLHVHIVRDAAGVSRGFGFVRYAKPEDAAEGLAALHGLRVRSRTLRATAVRPGKPLLSPAGRCTPYKAKETP